MKYDSVFYNNDRYYDGTAGAALLNVIREEKRKRYVSASRKPVNVPKMETVEHFTYWFCRLYTETHPPRKNGKSHRSSRPHLIRKYVKLYEYCMEHCDDDDFSVDDVASKFELGSVKKVEQCFKQRGNIYKVIECWNKYKDTGMIRMEDVAGGSREMRFSARGRRGKFYRKKT